MKIISKFKSLLLKNKIKSSVILIVLILLSIWLIRSNLSQTTTQYVFDTVKKGDVVVSVTGSGQISAVNQVDLKAKKAGELVYLKAVVGQNVKAGDLLAQVDLGDAGYELETARLNYEKLVNVDADDLRSVQDAYDQTKSDLSDARVSQRSALTTATIDIPNALTDVQNLLDNYLSSNNHTEFNSVAKDYVSRANHNRSVTSKQFDLVLKKYVTFSTQTTDSEIKNTLSETYQVATALTETIKYTLDAVVYLRDREDPITTESETAYDTVTALTSQANKITAYILSAQNTLIEAERNFKNAETNLNEVKNGPDVLDVRTKELTLRQKEKDYADYFTYAPFTGIVASVPVYKGKSVSAAETLLTLISKDKIAEISLNEVDAAKLVAGQEVKITLDALDELVVTGKVLAVDLVGSVTQGVVNYKVKVGFDRDDNRIKSGMTVNAEIFVGNQAEVLRVPLSAIKNLDNKKFLENIDETGNVQRIPVELGLVNDEYAEILSGPEEGQRYITKTITGTATTQNKAAISLFGTGQRPAGTPR